MTVQPITFLLISTYFVDENTSTSFDENENKFQWVMYFKIVT